MKEALVLILVALLVLPLLFGLAVLWRVSRLRAARAEAEKDRSGETN